MTITNDEIQFEESDFSDLSAFAKKSVPAYFGETPMIEHFGRELTNHIRIAKELAKQAVAADPKIAAVFAGLAAADEVKLAASQKCLDELQEILGVAVAAPLVQK